MYTTTYYIYLYVPEDAIDENIGSVEEGCKGSSKDHYYRPMGVTEEASYFVRREHACGCQRYLKLQDGCTLSLDNVTLVAGTTPKASAVKLYSAQPAP